jgi:hypothetical protein
MYLHSKNSMVLLPPKVNMEMPLLHSYPCGIITSQYHIDSVATASFPGLGGK